MCDHLNEIVLMLDSFFKGLTDVGLILSYSVQIQKISLEVTVTTKIRNLIIQLIKSLKIIYSKLSYCDHNSKNVVKKDKFIDASFRDKALEQEGNPKLLSTNENCEQESREIVFAYAPLSLASISNKSFLSSSSIINRGINESNQNSCSNNSLDDAECYLEQNVLVKENQTGSTNPALPDKLSTILDLGKTEINTERNEAMNAIKLFNVKSILISEDSLGNWNALHTENNVNEASNIQDCNGQTIHVLSSNTTVTSKDGSCDDFAEITEQQNCKCDLQLLTRQNIATVLVVESLNVSEVVQASQIGSEDELLKNVPANNVHASKMTYSECGCDDLTGENHVLELDQCFCVMCKKTFESIEELQEHRKVLHKGYGSFECSVCNNRFLTSEELGKHARKHDNQFKCNYCSKSFAKKLGLTRHLSFHEKKKEVACDICGKTFSRSDYMTIHKSIHAGKVLFGCKSCPKKFLYKRQLKLHEKVHAGVKDYVCEICSKAFSRNDKLKEHLMRHYNIKRFQCNVCSKYYAEKRDLRSHMKTQHENTKNSK